MRRYISTMLLVFIISVATATSPKYLFYFIGDGMGPSHVLGTELFLGECQGVIGCPQRLCFTQFPHTAFVTTYSASNGVTDSAASGTALATGHKTNNGQIGTTPDGSEVSSVATWAKEQGYAIGISTTVPINHATPASFYAHEKSRNNYKEIAHDLLSSNFDFFAGGDPIYSEDNRDELYTLYRKNGYTIVRGYNNYHTQKAGADKIMLFQEYRETQIPYNIDRDSSDLTLAQITKAGIDMLSRKSDKGFFFMIEGGKIDYASHSNDAATMMHEVLDFNAAIAEALEFYNKHPHETLIVVTADHETGGFVLGYNSSYTLNLKTLAGQKLSADSMEELIVETDKAQPLTWEATTHLLQEHMGIYYEQLGDKEKKQIKETFDNAEECTNDKEREEKLRQLATYAKNIVSRTAAISWASGNHSGTYVPLYAIGVGADKFKGVIDNTDIPKIIKAVAGF